MSWLALIIVGERERGKETPSEKEREREREREREGKIETSNLILFNV